MKTVRGSYAKEITVIMFSFALAFPSSIVRAQSAQQLENLTAFARAYGYVKYFHPSDEASSLDWGTFSIYGAERMVEANNQEELLQSLTSLFKPIAPSVCFAPSRLSSTFNLQQLVPPNIKGYEITYWQHLGLGKGTSNPSKRYRSVRVNRGENVDESSNFGNVLRSIDATPYTGRKIKFSGRAKIHQGSEGTGHLWVRADLKDKTTGFFNNMGDRPIVENMWKTYEIIGTVDEDAQNLVVGSFLLGNGAMSIDDLRLYFEQDGEWQEITEFEGAFEAGGFDDDDNLWRTSGNGYLIEVMPDVEKGNNHIVRIQHQGIYTFKKPSALFKSKPSKEEIWNKEIGAGISMTMPLTLYADEKHTFPQGDKQLMKTLIDELKDFASTPADLSFRLGNIINSWNVFQHFYPYFKEINVDWMAAFQQALVCSFKDKNEEDHLITLQKFTSELRDGHLQVLMDARHYFSPPIEWDWVEGQLVVTEVFDAKVDIQVGDLVSRIDGVTAEEFFENIHQRISSPTRGWRSYRANILSLLGTRNSRISIIIDEKEIILDRDISYYREVQKRNSLKEGYRFIENDIVYLNLDIISMDSIKVLLPQLEKSRAIIADLRGYPKGNHELLTHFLSKKDTRKWMHVPQIIYPDQSGFSGYRSYGWSLKPKKPYLGDKKIVFITDGQAISYAESFMGFIEGYNLATIVGQPTAGTNGNINGFQLPGRYTITFTGMKVEKHDGRPLHGVGILPDVYVQKTLKGVKERRDEFLEKAIEIANQN